MIQRRVQACLRDLTGTSLWLGNSTLPSRFIVGRRGGVSESVKRVSMQSAISLDENRLCDLSGDGPAFLFSSAIKPNLNITRMSMDLPEGAVMAPHHRGLVRGHLVDYVIELMYRDRR